MYTWHTKYLIPKLCHTKNDWNMDVWIQYKFKLYLILYIFNCILTVFNCNFDFKTCKQQFNHLLNNIEQFSLAPSGFLHFKSFYTLDEYFTSTKV
jgi:hypothetical protein